MDKKGNLGEKTLKSTQLIWKHIFGKNNLNENFLKNNDNNRA